MNRFVTPLILSASLVLVGSPVLAQQAESVSSRRIDGVNRAEEGSIQINQVDTSEFPRVNIFLSVSKDGRPLKNLAAKDFRIREDEVDQEPITVNPQLSPLSVVLTVDTSGSMNKSMGKVKEAAKLFLETLKDNDEVSVLGFARSVKNLKDFTSDKSSVEKTIDALYARGDTALYDAIYQSLENLKKRSGRKAVIVLSDGVDDDGRGGQLSSHNIEEALELASSTNIPVFTIGLGTEMDESLLKKVATTSGATYNNAPSVAELGDLYMRLGDELSGQYHVYYDSNLPGDGSIHRVSINYKDQQSYKEYTSPSIAGSVVPVKAEVVEEVEEPVAAVAEDSSTADSPFGKEIVGGSNFNSAVEIAADQLYYISSEKNDTQFFWFSLPRGMMANPFAHVLGKYGKISIFDADREPMKLDSYSYKEYAVLNVPFFASDPEIITDEERFYIKIERKGRMSLGVRKITEFVDAGTKSDARQEESTAIVLDLEKEYTGYFGTYDSLDYYVIELPEGKEKVTLKIRPSRNLSMRGRVINEEGYDVGKSYSTKKGNALKVEFTPKLGGKYYLAIEPYSLKDPIGAYTFVVTTGDEGVPSQPAVPKIKKIYNLRQ